MENSIGLSNLQKVSVNKGGIQLVAATDLLDHVVVSLTLQQSCKITNVQQVRIYNKL